MAYEETLSGDDFALSESTPGEESLVGTYQVDSDRVLMCDLARPLLLALTAKQTVTVSADSTETKSLDPEAPRVPFLPDPTAGEHTDQAFLVGFFDATGDGSKDTLVTDSTAVRYDSFGSDNDFVRSITLNETAGNQTEVDIYTIVRGGYGRIMRRDKGTSSVSDQLAKEDSVRWAFTNPDVPEGNRQINWPAENAGISGVIGPEQYVDIRFYDDDEALSVPGGGANDDSPTNLRVTLPFQKRPVRDDEDPAAIRERVRQDMVND